MIDLLALVTLTMLAVGTYTDVRWREVPDWISYSGIAAGLGIRTILTLLTGDTALLFSGLFGLTIGIVLGLAMFYTGQWGGGDSKALMAVGALFGFQPQIDAPLLSFLFNLVFIGGAYGMIWALTAAARHNRRVIRALSTQLSGKALPLSTFVGIAILASIITGAYLPQNPSLLITAMSIFLVPGGYLSIVFFKTVESCCFVKKTPLHQLTEGDWLARPVHVRGQLLCKPNNLGLTKHHIRLLKKKNVRYVWTKAGMPFIPVFLLTALCTLAFGNLFLTALRLSMQVPY